MAEKVIEELVVKISTDQKQFSKDMASLQGQVKKLAGSVDEGTKSFKGFGSTLKLAKGVLAGLGIAGGIQLIGSALKSAAVEALDFEKGIAEINSILPKNAKLTDQSSEAIRDLAAEFGTSQKGQAKAFYQIVSAGVTDTAKAMKLLKIANKAAVAGLTTTTTAINGLTSVMAVYEQRGLDAATASDILFASVREGKTTFGDLANNMGKISAIAAAAGVSFAELSGSLSFLTKSGLSTEEATTSLRALMTAIIKPTDDAKKVIKELGIDFSVSAIKTKGFASVMKELRDATGGNIETLSKVVPNVRALTAVAQIAQGDFKDFERILNSTGNTADDTSKAFKTLEETTQFKLDRAKAQITSLGTAITEALLPALGAAAEGLDEMFKSSSRVEKEQAALTRNVTTSAQEVEKLEVQIKQLSAALDELKANPSPLINAEQQQGQIDRAEKALGDLQNRLADAEERAFKESLNRNKKHTDDVIAEGEKVNQAQIEAIAERQKRAQEFDELQKEAAKTKKDEELATLAELVEGKVEADQDDLDRIIQKSDEENRIISEALANGTINQKEADQARIASNEKTGQAVLKVEEKENKQREKDKRSSFDTIATLAGSSNKTLAAIGKAAAITTATQDGIVAVQKALASAPPPLNYGLAAAVGVATAANVAKIAGLQGGIDSIPGVGTADNFPALLAPGERVVPAESNKDLTAFLQGNNGGQSVNNISIVVNDAFGVDTDQLGDRIIESINSASERSGTKIFRTALS